MSETISRPFTFVKDEVFYFSRRMQRDNQAENPASIRMRTRVWGLEGRA